MKKEEINNLTGGRTREKSNFVKLNRDADLFWKLVQKRYSAFVLLSIIAQRARRYFDKDTGLEVGEAWLGDFEKYNSTRSKYRTDLTCLIKLGIIAKRKHDRGTAAKLIDSTIFDINPAEEIKPVTINKNYEVTIKRDLLNTINSDETIDSENNTFLLAIHKRK